MPLNAKPSAVYLCAAAQVSAAGLTLCAAADTILQAKSACARRSVAGDDWPYFAMAWPERDPARRGEQILRHVAAELRASLPYPACAGNEAGLFIGSSSFQAGALEPQWRAGRQTRPPVSDFAWTIAQCFGVESVPWCFSSACTSSLAALAAATTLIEAGQLRHALVLGVELANDTSLAGFAALELLSATSCRPLDAQRSGMVLGEGVGALCLSREPPRTEGPVWRVAGWDIAVDGHSPTGPRRDGLALAAVMERALTRAGRAAQEIEIVKLHAAGSRDADAAEAAALRRVFNGAPPALVSLKSYLGHTLGASAALETAVLLACLARNRVPATAGFQSPDPELELRPTVAATPCAARRLLLDFIGFGGSLGALVLERER